MPKKPPKKSVAIEVIARGLLRHGQYLLACKNTAKNYYYLPGGHVEPNETAAAALSREIREESGAIVAVGPLLLACEVLFQTGKSPHHEYNFVFHVEHKSSSARNPPAITSREKEIEFEWIDQAAISDLDFRPRVIRAWLSSGGLIHQNPIGWASAAE